MVLESLLGLAAEAEGDAEAYEVAAREAVRALVTPQANVEPALLERPHDVRRRRGVVARLYRRRLARHALGNRR